MTFKGKAIRRRTVLGAGISAVAAGSIAALPCWTGAGRWRFFSDDEARTIEAICGQLIPADRDPGAREAGVVNYIDIQMARSFKRYQAVYRKGIARLDAASDMKFGKRFVELPSGQQVEALRDAEENSKEFFELILAHCRQGFYGDPRHGGNRDRASWKMLRLPYPQVRGRMHYDDQPKVG
jgi:gluconate 2-dehydrogenase gamma chain